MSVWSPKPAEKSNDHEANRMNETKFTPGPWTANFTGSISLTDEAQFGFYITANGMILVESPLKSALEADAHLIAAAPDMYAELLRLDPNNPAIAKARGEMS